MNVADEPCYIYSSKSNLRRLSTKTEKLLSVSKEESKRRNSAIDKSKEAGDCEFPELKCKLLDLGCKIKLI